MESRAAPLIRLVDHVSSQGHAVGDEVVVGITADAEPVGSAADTMVSFEILDGRMARLLAHSQAFRVSHLKRGYVTQLKVPLQLANGQAVEVPDMVVRLNSARGRLRAGEFTFLFTR